MPRYRIGRIIIELAPRCWALVGSLDRAEGTRLALNLALPVVAHLYPMATNAIAILKVDRG